MDGQISPESQEVYTENQQVLTCYGALCVVKSTDLDGDSGLYLTSAVCQLCDLELVDFSAQ